IDVFLLIVEFSVFESARRFVFESRANVFLSGKAEIAVQTRQVFLSRRGSAQHCSRGEFAHLILGRPMTAPFPSHSHGIRLFRLRCGGIKGRRASCSRSQKPRLHSKHAATL